MTMINEDETMAMQPQDNIEGQQPQEVDEKQSKSNTGKRVAATVAGSVLGVGGAFAAGAMMDSSSEQELVVPTPDPDPDPDPVPEPVDPVTHTTERVIIREHASTSETEGTNTSDYPIHGNADIIVHPTTEVHVVQVPTPEPESDIEVVDVTKYNVDGVEHTGVSMIVDGEAVALLDTNGNGEANLLAHDDNHNDHIEENEIRDVSDAHISMQPFEQQYAMEHQAEIHLQDIASADIQPDYNNDADIYDA